MRIVIVGAGEVGYHIASALTREGHDLVIVDRDPDKVSRLQSSLDVMAITGNGCDATLLRGAAVDKADLFFAVSNDDAANLLAALTARRLGASRCVVRIGEPAHGSNPLLQADPEVVPLYPERLVAEEILDLTRVPGASKARFFEKRRLALVHVRPSLSQDIYGRPLRDLRGPEGWILAGILRGAEIVVPRGDTVLWPGQAVYGVGRAETVTEFLSSLGVNGRPTRRVVIVGAGHVGSWLARLLVKAKIEVTVIQRGHQRAFDLASEVPEALVLQGDATEPAMLREAGIEEADYFVATTQDDEANVISSFLARELGARAVVALYQRAEFLNVLRAARVDLPLSPRLVTAGTILRMVHRREILSLDLVESGEAEVVEFQVPAKARVLRAPLQDLRFPHGAIVGAVVRGEDIFVPGGRFTFREGDRVLVFTLAATLPELERLFRGR